MIFDDPIVFDILSFSHYTLCTDYILSDICLFIGVMSLAGFIFFAIIYFPCLYYIVRGAVRDGIRQAQQTDKDDNGNL